MSKHKVIPIILDAFKYDGDLKGSDGNYYVPDWAVTLFNHGRIYYDNLGDAPGELFVKNKKDATLECVYHVSVGDYLVLSINNELFPIKSGIFEKLFEIIE